MMNLKTIDDLCLLKSLMAEWLQQVSHCHDLEVTSSNPGLVKLGVRSTSV